MHNTGVAPIALTIVASHILSLYNQTSGLRLKSSNPQETEDVASATKSSLSAEISGTSFPG